MGVGSGPIRVTGSLRCQPAQVAQVCAALPEHIRLSRAEAGCRAFDVVQAADDPCRFDLDETFDSRAAFDAHQARTRASDWWRVTQDMARDFQISEG